MRFSSIRYALISAASLSALMGCADLPSGPEPAYPSSDPLSSNSVSARPFGIDGLFWEMEREAPGFGGVFLASGGVVNVIVTADADRNRIGNVVRAKLRDRSQVNIGKLRYVTRAFDFGQLYAWKTRIVHDVHASKATSFGIDVSGNRIRIGSPNLTADLEIATIVSRHGVPLLAYAIVRDYREQLTGLITEMFGPLVPGGVGIRWNTGSGWAYCTAGVNGVLSGQSVLLIASHCTQQLGGVDGTEIRQGGTSSQHSIGFEMADAPWRTGPECQGGTACRYADVALMRWQAAEGRSADFGEIATTISRGTRYELEWSGSANHRLIKSVWDGQPFEGTIIDRIGGTTGWLYGEVFDSCQDRQVEGFPGYWMLCQTIVAGGDPEGGDSGGPAFSSMASKDVMFAGIVRSALFQGGIPFGFAFAAYDNIVADLGPVLVH